MQIFNCSGGHVIKLACELSLDKVKARYGWCVSVVLATGEAEAGGLLSLEVQSQLG